MSWKDFAVAFVLVAFAYVGGHADERDKAAQERMTNGDTKVDALGRVYQQPLSLEQLQAEGRAAKYRRFDSELRASSNSYGFMADHMNEQQRQKLYAIHDKYEDRISNLRKQLKQLEQARIAEALRVLDK